LFVSLIAGSALRSQFSAATLPEPAAWSQTSPNSPHSQPVSESATAIHLQHASSWDVSPANKKPFHSMWMTHDRPDGWAPLQSQSPRSTPPALFADTAFQSGDVHTGIRLTECSDQEILTLFCVARH
jgi:hypothetical protein